VPLSVAFELGIYEGDAFETWMTEKLAAKGVRTFADLRRPDAGDDRRFQHSLQVVVSDVTTHEMLVLPLDAERKLGIDPDALSVATAVRASMSIPVFFEPTRVTDPRDKREHVLVDGGLLSNFPVWVFDTDEPRWPTFGLLLVEASTRSPISKGITDTVAFGLHPVPAVDYAIALVQTMVEAHDRLYVEQADFARTIPIETLGVGTTEFALSPERREALYASGRRAAEKLLPFDFEAYLAAFRAGHSSRRESVRAAMSGGAASAT
jgi:NTE family protein